MKLARGKGLLNDSILKSKKSSNVPGVEAPEKKGFKDKKTIKKNGADKAFLETNALQRKALENSPVQVTILQRPETKEAALYNLARFNGVPLTELCAKNGLLLPVKSENSSRKACRELDLDAVKDNETLGISNLKGGYNSVVAPKFPNRLSRRHSSFEKVSEGLEAMTDLEPSCFHKVQKSSLTSDVTPVKAPNESVLLSSEETLPVDVPEFSSDDLSKSLWAAESLAEKWAGPCYTASPPPSSLPIPKFRLQRQSSSALEVGSSDQCEGLSLKYASASFLKERVPIVSGHSSEEVKHVEMDTAMATKDLRRILHLDFS
ncbi:hypothetical protein O6H91_06G101600 [Diphasiastrum complanatum]|nr:hypothetical protein O6H91_06G101600 [Diphasiastrum complanatum]